MGCAGIEHTEDYTRVTVEKKEYEDQRVLVLGLGNSAFETASHIASVAGYVHILGRSKGGLKFAYVTHYVVEPRSARLAN